MHVIYQCSEDGAGDTIKPRLTAAGADCSNVAFLDEEMDWLTLGDEKIRRAIADFNAKLLVIDEIYRAWGLDPEYNYRAVGRLVSARNKIMLLFDFSNAENWKTKKVEKS